MLPHAAAIQRLLLLPAPPASMPLFHAVISFAFRLLLLRHAAITLFFAVSYTLFAGAMLDAIFFFHAFCLSLLFAMPPPPSPRSLPLLYAAVFIDPSSAMTPLHTFFAIIIFATDYYVAASLILMLLPRCRLR